mgnify:FL=1
MGDKKEKFIIFALAGILLLIVCLPVKKTERKSGAGSAGILSGEQSAGGESSAAVKTQSQEPSAEDTYVQELERELEELLQCMEGAGRVKVMITLQSTGEEIVEKDRPASRSSVTEQDAAGGSRSTNDMNSEETTVFITDADGRQIPYVRKKLQPAVAGVAVLAEGGGREQVRRNISEAIQALFGIDANKIKIAKMKTTK